MATVLDLQATSLDTVSTTLEQFFANNAFEWAYTYEDQIILDALHPDFLKMMDLVANSIASYKGDMRGPLHVYFNNVDKSQIPFKPFQSFYEKVVENEYYFGNYNLGVFAQDDGIHVNIGWIA